MANEFFGSIGKIFGGGGSGGLTSSILAILIGVIALGVMGAIVYFFVYKKRQWNLKIEFKIPRNIKAIKQRDGSIRIIGTLNKEWGKGFYNSKNGVVLIKRKGKKALPMKPFDVKTYLSADGILTVIQVGIEDYRPVLDDSYIMVTGTDGKECALINAKIDTSEGKSWRNSYERERKNVYAISNWFREHGSMVALGIVVMLIFAGFGILWTRLPKICG